MKIIFLDCDGVLNSCDSPIGFGRYVGCDDDKLERLKRIVDTTGAKIVVSSTWRLDVVREGYWASGIYQYLLDNFERFGLEVFDITPDLGHRSRGREIHEWLEIHKDLDITDWVVLDDEMFGDYWNPVYDILKHLVTTEFYTRDGGLQDIHVDKAIFVLNGGDADGYELLSDNKE